MSDGPRRDEQTFDPTPRQREKFRQQGRVLLSHDLTTGLVLLASCTVFGQFGESAVRPWAQLTRHTIRTAASWEPNAAALRSLATDSLWSVAQSLLILVSAVMTVGTLTSLIQTRFNITGQPLKPDVSRLSWSKGWQRLWSRRSAVRALLAVVKLVLLAWVTWTILQQQWPQLPRIDALWLRTATGWHMVTQAGMWMSLCLIVLGTGDFLFQRSEYEQDLRMTREQLKEGQKQDEIDPHLRARIRKLQREQTKRRMLADVPRAQVIVTNPTHFAIAIRYDRTTMTVPQLVAKGKDKLAQRIIEIAREHDIPVVERKAVARVLYATVDVGQEVPSSLYHALAEILNYIYRLRSGGAVG